MAASANPRAKRRAAGPAVKKKPKKPGDTKRRVKRVALVLLATGLVFGLLGVGAFVVAYNAVEIPDPNEDFEAQTSKIYYADGETVLGEFATQDRESIPLDEMPQTMKDAVVAAENQTFWTDKGIDPRGILRAAFSNAQGNATQGASTITQQYVKILYLTQERSLDRKVREAILSLKLQRKMSKEQVLEGYLNTIYFGRGAYGVEAAAQAFFDKPAAELTLRESAVLASVLNNPTNLDPANGKEAKQDLKARYEYVLDVDGRHGHDLGRPRPTRRRSGCRSSPRSRRRASTAASAATCSSWCATSCSASATPRRTSTAAACGSPRRSPRTRWRRPRRARPRSGRRASTAASCTSRWRPSRSAPAPCSASTAARTTSTPRSTGRSRAAWRARRSRPSPTPPRSRTASRWRTPSTATPRWSCPTAPTSRTRATPPTAPSA